MIVSQLDPRGNIVHRFVLRWAYHPVYSLIFERGVERLRPRIVPANPRAPHRRPNPITLEVVQEPLRRVLAPPVGVKECHALLDRAPAYCHVNGLTHQGGVHVVGHRVPHDLLSTAVQNRRKLDKPGPRPDVGNVPAPLTPRLVGGEVLPHQVGALIEVLGRHGGTDLRPWLRGFKAQLPHDGADRGAIHPHPTPLQIGLDPSVPVSAVGVLKNVLDVDTELFSFRSGDGLRSVAPGVVAGP